jgi:SAM-dependent methyltransferase
MLDLKLLDLKLPDFKVRTDDDEQMDDFSIDDVRLTDALQQLRVVNQYLSGYSTTMVLLRPYLRSRSQTEAKTRILDVGTGIADFPEMIIRWAEVHLPKHRIEVVAIDANPVTVAYAQKTLRERLPDRLCDCIQVETADALALPYADHSFDIAIGAMFLHHFAHDRAVEIVRSMQRVSTDGILINDLHRHPLAYYGIYTLTRLFGAAEMVQHDGPISVLRGFRSPELVAIAQAAQLPEFSMRWRFPFRWLLTTVRF